MSVGVLVITAAFGSYLTYRRQVADTRERATEQAICAILNALPQHPTPAERGTVAERKAFASAYRVEGCHRPKVSTRPTRRPSSSSRPKSRTPHAVPTAPSPVRATVTPTSHRPPRVVVVVTKTAAPTPTHPSKSSPPPSCALQKALLGHCL